MPHLPFPSSPVQSGIAGGLGDLSRFAATLLPVRTVGVQGDGRTYSYVAAITSEGAPEWPVLLFLAKIITRLCHTINRVVYAFGQPLSGPVTDITPTLLVPEVLNQLRQADAIVNELLFKHDLVTKISQVPVVSVPVDMDAAASAGQTSKRCIAIRTFLTADFMTGIPACPGKQVCKKKKFLFQQLA